MNFVDENLFSTIHSPLLSRDFVWYLLSLFWEHFSRLSFLAIPFIRSTVWPLHLVHTIRSTVRPLILAFTSYKTESQEFWVISAALRFYSFFRHAYFKFTASLLEVLHCTWRTYKNSFARREFPSSNLKDLDLFSLPALKILSQFTRPIFPLIFVYFLRFCVCSESNCNSTH